MFLHLKARTNQQISPRAYRLHTHFGSAPCWVSSEPGYAALSLLVDTKGREYIDPGAYACLGRLILLSDSLPDFAKFAARLSVTPVPKEWVDACDFVLPLLGRLGFTARLKDRTLELECSENLQQPVKAAGVV